MFGPDFLRNAIIAAPVILFSLTVHEFFHAYTAYRYGDSTAKDMGRLTLNPLAHLDLFGTIVMVVSQFRIGWAKPVPVNIYKLNNPRKANLWISAAGPLSNIGMAFIAGLIFRTVLAMNADIPSAAFAMIRFGVTINLTLAFFNALPLFPLDGSHILKSLLPASYELKLMEFERFSPFLLILLVFTGAFSYVLSPFVEFFARVFAGNAIFGFGG